MDEAERGVAPEADDLFSRWLAHHTQQTSADERSLVEETERRTPTPVTVPDSRISDMEREVPGFEPVIMPSVRKHVERSKEPRRGLLRGRGRSTEEQPSEATSPEPTSPAAHSSYTARSASSVPSPAVPATPTPPVTRRLNRSVSGAEPDWLKELRAAASADDTTAPEAPVVGEAPVAEEAPVVETPVVEIAKQPTADAEEPVAEEPVAEEPVVDTETPPADEIEVEVEEAPVVETPVVEVPEQPTAEAEVEAAPVVEEPAADTEEQPADEVEDEDAPVVEDVVAEEPTDEPADDSADEAAEPEPPVEDPQAETSEPAVDEPAVDEPAVDEPAVDETEQVGTAAWIARLRDGAPEPATAPTAARAPRVTVQQAVPEIDWRARFRDESTPEPAPTTTPEPAATAATAATAVTAAEPAEPAEPAGTSAPDTGSTRTRITPLASMPDPYVFKPRRATRVFVTVVFVLGLVGTAFLLWQAYRDPIQTNIVMMASAGFTTAVLWAIRATTTLTRMTVRGGQLEVVRDGTRSVFDLTSTFTPVELIGTPGRRGWKARFVRRGMPPFVVDSSMVDPVEFCRVVRFHRPDDAGPDDARADEPTAADAG